MRRANSVVLRWGVGCLALALVAGVAALAVTGGEQGDATFQGGNGRIAYGYGDGYGYAYAGGAIWVANSDGSFPERLDGGGWRLHSGVLTQWQADRISPGWRCGCDGRRWIGREPARHR